MMSEQYRVLLVKPRQNIVPYSMLPPLGLMYLAAFIREKFDDIEVRIIDQTIEKIPFRDIAEMIRNWRPDMVGLSALSAETRALHRIAGLAKALRPETVVVAGGPHPSAYPERVMADENFDYVVLGEGELTFHDLVAAIRNERPVDDIDGLVFRRNAGLTTNTRERYIEDLDSLPYPAWDLIATRQYKYFTRMSHTGTRDYMPIFSSRSCPFHCLYCHNMFGKGFRPRSPENVYEEFRRLYVDYGICEFEIIDDIFNLDLDRAKRICDLIIESGMKIRFTFPNGIRGDRLDAELITKLRQAGCIFMAFAVETATPRLQKMLRKNINIEKIRGNISLARRAGIICQGFFMLGFPTETREELQATVDFAVDSDLHAAQLFMVNPFEGTELAQMAIDMGKQIHTNWDATYMSEGFTNLTDLSDNELDSIRRQGLRRFWLKPNRVWSLIRDLPDKETFPELAMTLAKRMFVKA